MESIQQYQDMLKNFDKYEYEKTRMDVYRKYVIIMILVNLLYYVLCELFFKASFGKKILGCEVRKEDGSPMRWHLVFIRAIILAFLLVLAVILQPLLNINAWSISLLFFIAIDITLPFKNQSLIDLGSKTIVFKKSVKRAI
jgi:uncharacterized RDD family membrane protein YckC